jgi:hypothetical protein
LDFQSHPLPKERVKRKAHTAQHAHPSAPQNDFKSAIGNRLDHAVAWLWPWTLQTLAQLQSVASRWCMEGLPDEAPHAP